MMDDLSPEVAPEPGEETSLDHLAGSWKIWQLRRGHRFSADDMLTAWMAAALAPGTVDQLDIGAGIGSVGLLTLYRLAPSARLTMVEVQPVSHRLARRTVETNQLGDRVSCRLGDLRDDTVIPESDRWELVTGSPPYIPRDKGVVSPHPQKAGARMELRGNIFDYARRAARAMRPDGIFVCCFSGTDPRAEIALAEAGLHLRVRQDVFFRAILPPTVALFAATRTAGPRVDRPPLVIRDGDGRWTDEYLQIRSEMGGPELRRTPDRTPSEIV